MKIIIINGPNLNLVGKRQPDIYGTRPLDEFLLRLANDIPGIELRILQSNHEGQLIDWLHEFGYDSEVRGIILNPGALAHYSLALADAISSIRTRVIEVHISNIFSREEFRRKSVTAGACEGSISGLGLDGYRFAINYLLEPWKKN